MKIVKRTKSDIKEDFVENLLLDRGIITKDEEFFNKFFNPTKENELEPELLDNIEEGYQLFKKHLINGSKFYLAVDSDCDGLTSASLFYNYVIDHLSEYNNEFIVHIPEGKEHGLDSIMDWFPEDGEDSLVILPDGGSNDLEQHAELRAQGYEILVLDHHICDRKSKDAIVINNQPSERYSNKDLSGVGIVYKFFEYFEEKENLPSYSQEYLDIVALGLIGDMMRMFSLENRYIMSYGLKHLKNEFFKTLIEKQAYSLKGKLNQIGVAFYIVPLINSLIRLGSPQDKEKLFKAFTHPELIFPSTKRGAKSGDTETICEQMARICVNTKNRQNKERDKALELLDIQIMENCLDENKIIVLDAEDLDVPKTMTGLCAMGVVSKYKKPVILGRVDANGVLRGSARGVNGSELQDFKQFLSDSNLMLEVAGHANAFGASLKFSSVDKLISYANEHLADINFNEGFYEVDFIINGNCSYLSQMIDELIAGDEFWGQDCPEALIAIENISLDANAIQFKGEDKTTIAFIFNGIEYIKFKDSKLATKLKQQSGKINLSVVGTPQINEWCGRTTRQIQIKEIEIKETDEFDF